MRAAPLLLAVAVCSGCILRRSSHDHIEDRADAAAGDDASGQADGAGDGSAVVFDNADGTFVWTPTRYAPCCGTEPGVFLDLTLAAGSQTGDASPSDIEFFISWDEANITPGGFYFRSAGDPGLSVAEGEPVTLQGGVVEMYTMHPPLAMNAGDTVGPTLTWRSSPQTVHLADPGGEYPDDHAAFTAGIIGVTFSLDDGVHYGFVDLAWNQPTGDVASGRHVPIRWGYNPIPDTPLVIPP